MIKIIDTLPKINDLFDDGVFNLEKWKIYMDSIYSDSAQIFVNEVNSYIDTGRYSFEKDFFPILNDVYKNSKLDLLQDSFILITSDLNDKLIEKFNRTLNVDIVLYLGLCNGAGRVTKINDKTTILLGVEKIIELDWYGKDSMYGLIYHELGHVYHDQYGNLNQNSDDNKKKFVWQLFIEGVAMYFEQTLVEDYDYYHQDVNGWKNWCDQHFNQILRDFNSDLPELTQYNQRYFGDWADYYGKSDIGYYLGTRYVKYLLNDYKFNEIINFDIYLVYDLYLKFLKVNLV